MPNETHKTKVECTACAQVFEVTIQIKVERKVTATSTRLEVDHIDPVKCPACGTYMQVLPDELHINYSATQLKTA